MTTLNPYLSFGGNARDAMAFYKSVFGGELEISDYQEYASPDPADQGKVMHAMLRTDSGLTLMGADAPAAQGPSPNGSISLSGPAEDDAELRGYWASLSEGGMVAMPLEVAPWGDAFGMCTDKFGVTWMVNVAGAATES